MNIITLIQSVFPAILLSFIITLGGNRWISKLYINAQQRDILSFPGQTGSRAKFRKPLLFVILFLCICKAWMHIDQPFILGYTILAITFLSFITITDFEQYVIFDAMLLPFSVVGLFYTLQMQFPLGEHIAAALGGGLLLFLLAVVTNGAIGGGDIKLVAAMGLWFGYPSLLTIMMYGFLAGGVAALLMLLLRQKNRHSYFAYGPYFALSGIGILLGLIPF